MWQAVPVYLDGQEYPHWPSPWFEKRLLEDLAAAVSDLFPGYWVGVACCLSQREPDKAHAGLSHRKLLRHFAQEHQRKQWSRAAAV